MDEKSKILGGLNSLKNQNSLMLALHKKHEIVTTAE